MREPSEIRRGILVIRDKKKLTMTTICDRARVSRHELHACFSMRATEDTLRKLDAYLDAPKLHERNRDQTLLEYQIELLSREMWRRFRIKTPHPKSVEDWGPDRQRKYLNEMTWRAKGALQREMLTHGIVVKIPDGATYWQYEKRCIHRLRGEEAIRTGDRDSRRVPWPRPVLQGRS